MHSTFRKHFRNCVHSCKHYLTPDDSHDLCVICMGKEHAPLVLEGAEYEHCESSSMKKLCSCLSLFSRELGQAPMPHGLGPTSPKAKRKLFVGLTAVARRGI